MEVAATVKHQIDAAAALRAFYWEFDQGRRDEDIRTAGHEEAGKKAGKGPPKKSLLRFPHYEGRAGHWTEAIGCL